MTLPIRALLLAFYFGVVAAASGSGHPTTSIVPYDLTVDNRSAPLGVDSPAPRFAWKLNATSPELRGARQTAWQIRVGASPAAADVWDGAKITSAEHLNVSFAGRPLQSHERLFWQVRVWDEADHVSGWSEPADFTMGVLQPADWEPAHWITDPALLVWQRKQLGYSSTETDEPKWVQLDLGSAHTIDRVRFYPVRHTVTENLGFPRNFKLEASDDVSFTSARLMADYTDKNYGTPWSTVIDLATPGVETRYLRFTAPQAGRLALAQIEVLSDGKNIAPEAGVSANHPVVDARWSPSAAVDGLGVPGTNPLANSTLRLRREFAVRPGLRRAVLHVSGLGQYSLHLNGQQPDIGLLTPGWTNYEKTVLYDTYDVTAQLHGGANAIGLELAGGMYNVQPGRYVKFVSAFRPLTALAQLRLEYTDGSVDTLATDTSWRVSTANPVTFSNIYGGEDYDARLETKSWDRAGFDDRQWTPAVTHPGRGGELRGASHASPPFRTFEVLKPAATHELRPGVTVYDLGQNTSLTLHLRVRGEVGSSVKILPAELLHADGSIDRDNVGHAEASWNYTLAGRNETEDWRPAYFYHGARYLQVERTSAKPDGVLPEIEAVEGAVTHSASPPAGDFECSSELFNRIRLLIRWAQRSNLAHVISDCPHRERLGWLEQYHLNGPALRYEWDLTQLYTKCFDDMADAQTDDGLVPDIAPEFVKFSGGFRDSPEWGSALILSAWQHYVWTADDAPLRRHYAAMCRYLDYLASKSKEHLLNHGLGDWYDLGPKPPGVAQLTPIALTATAIYYEDTVALARIATHLGRAEDAREFQHRADEIKAAFNHAFLNPATGIYATGSQTAQAMPLVLDLVPDAQRAPALAALIRDIETRGYAVTAGDVGYRYVLRALANGGRSDVIYAMNNQSDKPGYGYQLAQGATSLTEAWDANPKSSQNHFMLGQIMEWFHGDLAGLAPDPEVPGFAHVIVKPQPVAGIDWARARHESPQGPVAVEWHRDARKFTLKVTLPPNASAWVYLPATADAIIQEHGVALENAPGVKLIQRDQTAAVMEVAAGNYEFTAMLR